MQKTRLSHLLVSLSLGLSAIDAAAIGFLPVEPSTTLGRTLDHAIGLRLDPGERLEPECVAAEVVVGETRLPPEAVRTRLEGEGTQRVLRVRTTVPIDEPLVAMSLSLGCPPKLQRRFVVFADPVAPSAPSAPMTAVAASSEAASRAEGITEVRAVAPETAAVPAVRGARAATIAAREATTPAPRPPRRRAARRTAPAATPAAPAAPAPAAVGAGRPRLQLDPEPVPVMTRSAEALQAEAAEAAAQAAAEAASAAAQRIAALEQAIERLRTDSAADREALLELRRRAAEADQSAQWTPWLLALAAALALICAWLWLKLRRLQQEGELAWAAAARGTAAASATHPASDHGPVPTVATPITAGEGKVPHAGVARPPADPGTSGALPAQTLSEPTGEVSTVERTEVLPLGWRAEEADDAQDVSIEMLIDLEQQAEFFVVLGQEDAAIDLLVEHLRNTGGGSPVPYLKLLEIYRRQGDREAYERTRTRFNHRFNAYAPDWSADPGQGRPLEDYPSIIARLQQVWASPIDAMAELESLLFRKARGETFDLPAYRDVMFLYSLARDLLDRESLERGDVDVLLPISEGGEGTQPMSLEDLPAHEDSGMMDLDQQPTVPLDLDVTQPLMPESLFGDADVRLGGLGRGRGG
ncbi:MAG TPA: hypothetical protein PKJ45_12830 [Rubrivivax sp.]|nr:hypothetical protein [Rubrivivax sp.]